MKIPILVNLERKWRAAVKPKKTKIIVEEKRTSSIYKPVVPLAGICYSERKETGPKNLQTKLEREKMGRWFEWPEMIATNKAIVGLLRSEDKNIVNIGAGTGTFEYLAATEFPNNRFVASEFDRDCVTWCKKNRQFQNVEYTSLDFEQLKERYKSFDCLVSVDVIEHIKEFPFFLRNCASLAPRAIIATPNKDRSVAHAIAPAPLYVPHVQEWNAGELYWVLKCFYKNVTLYSIIQYENAEKLDMMIKFKRVGLMSAFPKLIACCEI